MTAPCDDSAQLRAWLEYVAQTAIDLLDDLDAASTDLEDDELGDDLIVRGGGVMSPLHLAMTRSRPFPPGVGAGDWFVMPPLYRSTIVPWFEEGFAGRDSDVVWIRKSSSVGLTEIGLAWELRNRWCGPIGEFLVCGMDLASDRFEMDLVRPGDGDDFIRGERDGATFDLDRLPPQRRGRFKRNARRARK